MNKSPHRPLRSRIVGSLLLAGVVGAAVVSMTSVPAPPSGPATTDQPYPVFPVRETLPTEVSFSPGN